MTDHEGAGTGASSRVGTATGFNQEWELLGKAMLDPSRFVVRRTTTLSFTKAGRLKCEVVLQQKIPEPEPSVVLDRDERMVSLGLFEKGSLPDLRAFHGAKPVPIAKRSHTAALVARATRFRFRGNGPVFGHLKVAERKAAGAFDSLPTDRQKGIEKLVFNLVRLPADEARKKGEADIAANEESSIPGVQALYRNATFLSHLRDLYAASHIIAFVDAAPGENLVLTLDYTMDPGLSLKKDGKQSSDAKPRAPWKWVRSLLRWFGLVPFAIRFGEPNAEHVSSLHTIIHAPRNAQIEDAYWQEASMDSDGGTPESEYRRGQSVALSNYKRDELTVVEPSIWFGLQLEKAPALPIGAFLAAVIWLVLSQISREGFTGEDRMGATLLIAIAGFLLARVPNFGGPVLSKVGQGPRSLLLVVGGWPIAQAVGTAFGEPFGVISSGTFARIGASLAGAAVVLSVALATYPRVPWTQLRRESHDPAERHRWWRIRDYITAICFALALFVGSVAYIAAAP